MISEKICQRIVSIYNNGEKSFNEVARLSSINNVSVKNILKRKGIVLHDRSKFYRKYDLDEHYFENIDTEEKAYFLGLILADGCITKKNSLIISLQEEDKHILDKFIFKLKYGGKLRKIIPKNKNHKIQYSLSIGSKKIARDLMNLGIVPNKSLIVEFPNINNELLPHFIRGNFDGDGSVHKSIRKSGKEEVKIQFIGSISFISKLAYHLNNLGINPNKIKLVNNSKNATINLSSKENILKFKDLIYKDATIYLFRKCEKFSEVLSFFNNKKFFYRNEPIYQYSINKKFIKKWESLDELIKETKSSRQCILRCIRGKIKTANNHIWSITKI